MKRTVLAMVAVAVCGFSRTGFAQQPPPPIQAPSTKGVVRKNKVPVSSEILKITLPKAAEPRCGCLICPRSLRRRGARIR